MYKSRVIASWLCIILSVRLKIKIGVIKLMLLNYTNMDTMLVILKFCMFRTQNNANFLQRIHFIWEEKKKGAQGYFVSNSHKVSYKSNETLCLLNINTI